MIISIFLVFFPLISEAAVSAKKLSGRIVLQVEENGEAWYINPANLKKYFMGRPENAFVLMHELGIGISNSDIEKIEIAEANFGGVDNDRDGLSNIFENAIGTDPNNWDSDFDGYSDKEELFFGYNPLGSGKKNYDKDFTEKHKGKIFLQVENNGEAWYVNPEDRKRYFLGRPGDAFNVMKSLGLGISNQNLYPIPSDEAYEEKFNKRLQGEQDEYYRKIITAKNECGEANSDNVITKERSDLTNEGELVHLAGKYSLGKENVYYDGYILEGADVNSFQVIDDYYAKDRFSVFIDFRPISGADPETFEVLGHGYSKDKNNAYYKYDQIPGAIPASFKVLNTNYGADSASVYFKGEILSGISPSEFSIN